MMQIRIIKEKDELKESLRALTEQFEAECPYYREWLQKNQNGFEKGSRMVYALDDEGGTVGYMMVHCLSGTKYAKINSIYVFPEFQGNGYAKQAFSQIIAELKAKEYEYVYAQARIYNVKVVHVFHLMHFRIIGERVHQIEKERSFILGYDLSERKEFDGMLKVGKELYPGLETENYD